MKKGFNQSIETLSKKIVFKINEKISPKYFTKKFH